MVKAQRDAPIMCILPHTASKIAPERHHAVPWTWDGRGALRVYAPGVILFCDAQDREPAMARSRPLSPHLQIYRPAAPGAAVHLAPGHRRAAHRREPRARLTGWPPSRAAPRRSCIAQARLSSLPGRALLLVLTFSFFYHLANGIRHLFWMPGLGFELRTANASGVAVIAARGHFHPDRVGARLCDALSRVEQCADLGADGETLCRWTFEPQSPVPAASAPRRTGRATGGCRGSPRSRWSRSRCGLVASLVAIGPADHPQTVPLDPNRRR